MEVVNSMNTKSLYIQILERCWATHQVPTHATLTSCQEVSSNSDLEHTIKTNQIQMNEPIRHIKQIYHLERRLFL